MELIQIIMKILARIISEIINYNRLGHYMVMSLKKWDIYEIS